MTVRLPGRFQVFQGNPEWILDVAHNTDAAQSLAASLAARPCSGSTIAVCGILGDKDVEAIVAALSPQVRHWIAVGLEGPRAISPAELAQSDSPRRRRRPYTPRKVSPPEWPRRGSSRSPATGSSYLVRS